MQSKLKFLSMLIIVFSIMCFAPTVFGAKEMFYTYIDEVKANIQEPVKGNKPSFILEIETPSDKVTLNDAFENATNGIIWIDETDSNKQLSANDTFQAGHQYRLRASLKTNGTGVRFKKEANKLNVNILLNENKVNYSYAEAGSNTIIVFEYPFKMLPEDKTNGRTPINTIEATSNYNDIAYMYGNVHTPKFEITNETPVSFEFRSWESTNGVSGATVSDLKPDDKNWKNLNDSNSFSGGFLRLQCQLRIDGEAGKKYYISEDATLKVNGIDWILKDFRIEDDYSYCYATSPVFQPIEREDAKSFTVYFDTKGGNKIEPLTGNKYGTWIPRPVDPICEGYTFIDWYEEEDYGHKVVFADASNNNTEIVSDMTIYAKWEKNKEEQPTPDSTQPEQPKTEVKYEVEFNSNGGSKVATQEVAEKEKVTIPPVPTKDGYTFEAWCTNKKLTKYFDFETEVTDDIVLYAKWIETEKVEEPVQTPTEQPTETPVKQEKNRTWSKASEWAVAELDKANALDVIPEIFNKQDLTQNITRKEFAHVAVKLYEKLTNSKAVAIANNPFTDTDDVEVLKAYNIGITNGTSETTFAPDDLITREQMATMMTRALTKAGIDTTVDLEKVAKFDDDSEMHDWGKASIYYMSNIEIIKGVGNNKFGVLGNATREQSLLISERSAEKFAK